MLTRRSFLKSSAVLSAGVLALPHLPEYNKKYIGLQLYTVRDAMQQDPKDTLAKVAKIGYNSVEGATYTGSQQFYGMDAKAFKQVLSANGLIMPSSHYRLGEEKGSGGEQVKGTMLSDWDKAVDDAAEVGIKYMVCAYLAESERGNLDHYKYVAEQLKRKWISCGS